ncbi:MAG: hypothetical protein ACEQSR_08440 [Candidatus Methylacidiphilales bacterium]
MNWYYKLWVGAIQKAYRNTGSFKSEKDKNFQMLMTFSLAQLLNLFFIDGVFFLFKINFRIVFLSKNGYSLNFIMIGLYFLAFYFLNYFLIFYKKRWEKFDIVNKDKLTEIPYLLYFVFSVAALILLLALS